MILLLVIEFTLQVHYISPLSHHFLCGHEYSSFHARQTLYTPTLLYCAELPRSRDTGTKHIWTKCWYDHLFIIYIGTVPLDVHELSILTREKVLLTLT